MKLYKYYKDNCYPCKTVTAILKRIEIPKDIEIVEINAELEENKELVEKNNIEKVPVLLFEDGRKLAAAFKPLIVIEKFIKGE